MSVILENATSGPGSGLWGLGRHTHVFRPTSLSTRHQSPRPRDIPSAFSAPHDFAPLDWPIDTVATLLRENAPAIHDFLAATVVGRCLGPGLGDGNARHSDVASCMPRWPRRPFHGGAQRAPADRMVIATNHFTHVPARPHTIPAQLYRCAPTRHRSAPHPAARLPVSFPRGDSSGIPRRRADPLAPAESAVLAGRLPRSGQG